MWAPFLLGFLVLLPLGATVPSGDFPVSSDVNLWQDLAQRVLNTSNFCLPRGSTIKDIFVSCIIGIPAAPSDYHAPLDPASETFGLRGHELPGLKSETLGAGMYSVRIGHLAPAPLCFSFQGCNPPCLNLSNSELLCNHSLLFPPEKSHLLLPKGWFLLCGLTAYTYVPANATGGPCSLGRLTAFLPSHQDLRILRSRRPRRSLTFGPDCDDHLALKSSSEIIAAAFFTPGVAAAINYRSTIHLACGLIKNINFTSQALAALTSELTEVRGAVLENRWTIDYLLLKHHHGCKDFLHMCCFNLSDHSAEIQKDIAGLHNITEHITIDQGLDLNWGWLTSWLPDLSKIEHGLVWVGIFILGFVCLGLFICIWVNCLPSCCVVCSSHCFPRRVGETGFSGSQYQGHLAQLAELNGL